MRRQQRAGERWPGAFQHVAIVLGLVLLAHQLFLAAPIRMSMSVMLPMDAQITGSAPCDVSCPSTLARLCVPDRTCMTVQAAFNRSPALPLLIAVLLLFTAIAVRTPVRTIWRPAAFWPPQQYRALLQIFLI